MTTTAIPLPVRATMRDLLADLLGVSVSVVDGPPQRLDAERPAYAAAFRTDEGAVAAVCVCEQPFVVGAGAALGMLAIDDAREQLAAGGAQSAVLEFSREVVNALAKLLNSPSTPQVALAEYLPLPGEVPADLAAMITEPGRRLDYAVTCEGYDEGLVTLLS